jgi:hypothetical protein
LYSKERKIKPIDQSAQTLHFGFISQTITNGLINKKINLQKKTIHQKFQSFRGRWPHFQILLELASTKLHQRSDSKL